MADKCEYGRANRASIKVIIAVLALFCVGIGWAISASAGARSEAMKSINSFKRELVQPFTQIQENRETLARVEERLSAINASGARIERKLETLELQIHKEDK